MKNRTKFARAIAGSVTTIAFIVSSIALPLNAFADAPSISFVTPSSGPISGGTPITISGTGFATDTIAVLIGGSSVPASVLNDSSMVATTTASSAGAKSIVVSNADGTATSSVDFTFTEASSTPTLDSIAITSLPSALIYFVGDSLNLSGLVVTETFSDHSTSTVPVTMSNISGFNSSVPASDQTVTVTVDGKTATFTVSIIPHVLSLATSTDADGNIAGTIPSDTEGVASSSGVSVKVDLSAGTIVTASASSSWNGTLTLPNTTNSFTLTPSSGNTATAVAAITTGAGDIPLMLSLPAKITFVGQSGKLAGWSRSGVFTPITTTCDSSTSTPTLATGTSTGATDCTINVGADLVVWTTHLTTFIAYTQTAISSPTPTPSPSPAPSSGGGNGPPIGSLGGGSIVPGNAKPVPIPTPTPTPTGQVLGATTYNFTTRLAFGSTGEAVTALQNILTGNGFYSGPITGYFGALTRAAVKAFQSAKGIDPIGIVGPQTRAALNSLSGGSMMSDSARQTLIAQLMQKLQQLEAQVAAMTSSTTSATTTTTTPTSTTTAATTTTSVMSSTTATTTHY